jgi:hypothetical protein
VNSFWDFVWYLVLIFLFVAYLMILFSIISDIFRSQDMGGLAKGVWIVALLFLPLITALIYLIVRGSGMAERSNKANVETAKMILAAQGQHQPSKSASEEIAHAKQLLDAGTITQQEFDALKAKALT